MLYAIQFESGNLLAAYQQFDSDDSEFHTYSLSEATTDEVPFLSDNTADLNHWLSDAREGRSSYDAPTDLPFRARLAAARIVEVEITVIGEVR